ncbi:unknown [Sutterella wadsworthensis CAG:135]|nr:unknown [Sutterella wadsworthensis CAG:135]
MRTGEVSGLGVNNPNILRAHQAVHAHGFKQAGGQNRRIGRAVKKCGKHIRISIVAVSDKPKKMIRFEPLLPEFPCGCKPAVDGRRESRKDPAAAQIRKGLKAGIRTDSEHGSH